MEFLRDVLTVLRKELLELVGSRRTARGPIVQALVMVAMAGVLIPMNGARAWSDARFTALLFFTFPSMLAAAVAADAFAGERERRTLETLLATPLPDAAIFVGKVATSVLFACATAAATLLAGFATVNARYVGSLYLPPSGLWIGCAGAALGSSFAAASLAVGVSVRTPFARSAQQLSAVTTLVIIGGTVGVLKQTDVRVDWAFVARLDAVLLAIGSVALGVALALFRRDRLLERR